MLISNERKDEILHIHADHLGTPRAVTDSKGNKQWQWEGDAFGNVTPQLEAVKMPLRMAGQYHDSETGLFCNYYRYYDPATGHYLRSDPIGLAILMPMWVEDQQWRWTRWGLPKPRTVVAVQDLVVLVLVVLAEVV